MFAPWPSGQGPLQCPSRRCGHGQATCAAAISSFINAPMARVDVANPVEEGLEEAGSRVVGNTKPTTQNPKPELLHATRYTLHTTYYTPHPRRGILNQTPVLSTQDSSWGYLKVISSETLSIFGDKCPQNSSKNDLMAPRTTLECPHEGPSVAGAYLHSRLVDPILII